MSTATETRYRFKESAHIPRGVTPDGVMKERAEIKRRYGRVTIAESAEAVLAEPERFPNLRAFAPATAKEALRRCVEEGIGHAYRSIVTITLEIRQPKLGERREVPIRALHPVTVDDDGRSYETLDAIKENPDWRKEVIRNLRRDAEVFSDRLRNALAELEAVHSWTD
jgi:hypothetical protein